MATTKKLTKRDHFNALIALDEVQANSTLTDFIQHELELLEKKNGAEKKPTVAQQANEVIKAAIFDGMADNTLYTISELQKKVPACEELSNQRVSALVRQMVADGLVTRVEDKRKAYFSKVSE